MWVKYVTNKTRFKIYRSACFFLNQSKCKSEFHSLQIAEKGISVTIGVSPIITLWPSKDFFKLGREWHSRFFKQVGHTNLQLMFSFLKSALSCWSQRPWYIYILPCISHTWYFHAECAQETWKEKGNISLEHQCIFLLSWRVFSMR